MAHQITLEEAASRLPDLVQAAQRGQEVVFLDGLRPVARLMPLTEDPPTAQEIAALAMAGGAFDWLADEPDLYDDTCGEAIA